MSELTAEKRAELRSLADKCKTAVDGIFVMSGGDMQSAEQAHDALHGALCHRTLLSLLDALDAAEAEAVALRQRHSDRAITCMQNMGIDVECPGCMQQAFTASNGSHTCKRKETR